MKLLFALAFLSFEALAIVRSQDAQNPTDNEWEAYKSKFSRNIKNPEEERAHFERFNESRNYIKQHESAANAMYQLKLNEFADYSQDKLNQLTGLQQQQQQYEDANSIEAREFLDQILRDESFEPPAEVDWRQVPDRVHIVRHQLFCAADWAFATIGLLEGQQVARNFTKELIPLSAQNVVSCTSTDRGDHHEASSEPPERPGCLGGRVEEALESISRAGGIQDGQSYLYEGADSKCEFQPEKRVMSTAGPVFLPRQDEETLKRVVARYGPVATYIQASAPSFHLYDQGIYTCPEASYGRAHAVLVVGYGTTPEGYAYWILRNSWSRAWGEAGYMRLARNSYACQVGERSVIARF